MMDKMVENPTATPEGWFLEDEKMVTILNSLWYIIPPFIYLAFGLLTTSGETGYFADIDGFVAVTVPLVFSLMFLSGSYAYVRSRIVATYERKFRVADPTTVVNEFEARLPLSVLPLKRSEVDTESRYDQSLTKYRFDLREDEGVQTIIHMEVDSVDGLLEVSVDTSDKNSRVTRDILTEIVELMKDLEMNYPEPEVVKERERLTAQLRKRDDAREWDRESGSRGEGRLVMLFYITIGALWLIVISPLVTGLWNIGVAIMCVIGIQWISLFGFGLIAPWKNLKREGIVFDHSNFYHASPGFILPRIEEGLTERGIAYERVSRLETDLRMPVIRLDLKERPVSIDLMRRYIAGVPSYTRVHIRTARVYPGVEGLQEIVNWSIFDREVAGEDGDHA